MTGDVAGIAAAVVGAVFVFSGVTKIARPVLWQAQATQLGVPGFVVVALPFIEPALGALLITQWQRRWVAPLAVAVLVAFTTLLVLRLRQGRRPPCACFGSLSMRPIGWRHIARNAAFVALAVFAALG